MSPDVSRFRIPPHEYAHQPDALASQDDLSGLARHRASPRPDFGAQPAHAQQSYARGLLRLRELPADRLSADQRAALARVPTDGGQELPLNNTLIEVELE